MSDIFTGVAQASGAIAVDKNTVRVHITPGQFIELATTGTWVQQVTTNVPELFTTDASTTNVLQIPMPAEISALASQSAGVDRGIQVVGLELMYDVATSALASMDIDIFRINFAAADGAATAVAVPDTTTFLPDGNDGTEVDVHRVIVSIAANDRFFLDGDSTIYANVQMTDGTASDITISGAIWHLRRVYE